MGQLQDRFFSVVAELGFALHAKPRFSWLQNTLDLTDPANKDLKKVFEALKGDATALTAKRATPLHPDGFLIDYNCLLEFDELQHFTSYRLTTLECYPPAPPLGFDADELRRLCLANCHLAERKGAAGYRKPKPEFPFEGGRHAQRAFFDACRDLLPPQLGLRPTIRIFEAEVPSLLHGSIRAATSEISDAIKNRLNQLHWLHVE
jgi:hypothetical protein